MTPAEKCEAAERFLHEHGLSGVRVRTAGHADEVAAVGAPPDLAARLAELAPAIKALGFRYVALELDDRVADPGTEQGPE